MPDFCAVVGCGSRGNRDSRSFFRIPAISKGSDKMIRLTKERREKWIAALKRKDLTATKLKNARICDKHFINGRPAKILDTLNPDWIPSKLMGYQTKNISPNRYKRGKLRLEASTSPEVEFGMPSDGGIASSSLDILDSASVEVDDPVSYFPNQGNLNEGQCCVGTQTYLTMEKINKLTDEDISNMSDVINQQTVDIVNLKEKLNNYVVKEESFKDDKKTKFYTGLDKFQILMILFNLISNDLKETPRSSLSKFQQLILTLQRLRLNLSLTDLAYRNAVSVSTASKVFQNCLYILHKKLKRFIVWPEREVLRKTMPSIFLDTLGHRVSVIIDCFEIKMEKPSSLLPSAQVWSNYKHHHTAKFLIGITPQGSISFISEGYGGRTSDKELALKCGILEKLLPGDIVLSDRGFLISDEVGLYCAEVKMPCFTKGKNQLSPYEVEKNREISNLRIHVERVIGSLRQKYQILHSVLPIHVFNQTFEDAPSLLNQMVNVCCALINLCPTVVPLD